MDSELSDWDLVGGKTDAMELEDCGIVSLGAEPEDSELFGGKIEAMEAVASGTLPSLIGLLGWDMVGGAIDYIKEPKGGYFVNTNSF